jgi:hypothetical protein
MSSYNEVQYSGLVIFIGVNLYNLDGRLTRNCRIPHSAIAADSFPPGGSGFGESPAQGVILRGVAGNEDQFIPFEEMYVD